MSEGQLISYEEYFPFGSTAFTAGSNATEVALKAYRYTGKECEDTTGLYYYGARYYAPWMGRWLNPDPAGTVDGLNVFRYVRNNPIISIDLNGEETSHSDEQVGLERIGGIVHAKFIAGDNAWISASAKSIGLDSKYSKAEGYGAYKGIALDENFSPLSNPDQILPGDVYFLPLPDQAKLKTESFNTDPQISVYHVNRDLDGPLIGSHAFVLIVPDDPSEYDPFKDPFFSSIPNLGDAGNSHQNVTSPKLVDIGDGRKGFLLGGYNVTVPGQNNKLEFRFNELTDLRATNEHFDPTISEDDWFDFSAEKYEINHDPNIRDVDFVRNLISGGIRYSTEADIDYPSVVQNIGNPINSNSFAYSLLYHSGATNVKDNLSGKDSGGSILLKRRLFFDPFK